MPLVHCGFICMASGGFRLQELLNMFCVDLALENPRCILPSISGAGMGIGMVLVVGIPLIENKNKFQRFKLL